MSSLVKVFDPNTTKRPVTVVYTEETCPGLLEFFSTLPYRTESSLIRTIVHDWFVSHREAGTLDAAVAEIVGQGTRPAKRMPKRPAPRAVQSTSRSPKTPSAVSDASSQQSNGRQQGGFPVAAGQTEHMLQSSNEPNVTIGSAVATTTEADRQRMEPKADPVANSHSMEASHSQNRSEILESISFLDDLP